MYVFVLCLSAFTTVAFQLILCEKLKMALISHSSSLLVLNCFPSPRIQMRHNSQTAKIQNNLVRESGKLCFKALETSEGNQLHNQRAEKLKEVRDELRVLGRDHREGLVMVDALQRLGIDYHFEHEIWTILSKVNAQQGVLVRQEKDLFQMALGFRLLRQEGYFVSADVFRRFLDKDVKFMPELSSDVKGWSNLYEASHLCMEDEDILVQAEGLSRHILAELSTRCNHHEANNIDETLGHPHHKNLARFRIKNYINNFERNNKNWRYDMKQLAKIDFNIVQLQHRRETQLFYEWWENKGLANEMKLARNQPTKWYLWSMATLADPIYSDQRVDITKPVSLIYMIDDVYDVYGTVEELALFTEAVNRWDYASAEQLPRYMRECFRVLDETTNELSHTIFTKYGHNAKDSLQKSWADLCNAFLMESKWFAKKHLPAPEDYLKNGTVSSGVYVFLVHMFFLMGENMTKSCLDILTCNSQGMGHCVATMIRLWDDLGTAKDENQDGADGSYLECYMNKHKSVSQESAQEHVKLMISHAWKRLNTECLTSSDYSSAFRKSVLNFARMVPLMYSYDSNGRLPAMDKQLSSQLYESFSLVENHETDNI